MLSFLSCEQARDWDKTVRSYPDWDIYYLCAYVKALEAHGDGRGYLIEYTDGHSRVCYVIMQKDIANDARFKNSLPAGQYYDWETPYGYGGPLWDGEISEEFQKDFLRELSAYCTEKGIVSQFVRFHPLLQNQTVLSAAITTRYMRDTIVVNTESEETIWQNLDGKNRNMVRKAQKSGVVIEQAPLSDYADFLAMYLSVMEWHRADEYYFFAGTYFDALCKMRENGHILYAALDGRRIAGSIVLYNEHRMHYHLSGSIREFRNYAPTNLLLYEAAVWACREGIGQFHLGGGNAPDDSLFGFKKQFNKNGRLPWYVGRTIFDPRAYQALLRTRKQNDDSFDEDNSFMIQYRR